jgi:hypothetical protein
MTEQEIRSVANWAVTAGGFMSSAATRTEVEIVAEEDTPKWFGEPVSVSKGPPEVLKKLIPRFDRRPFSLGGPAPAREREPSAFHATGENRLSAHASEPTRA